MIVSLRHRITVTEDPAMSAMAPRLRPARVTVVLTDGRSATHACDSHRGDYNQPFTDAELRNKFRELAGTVLTQDGVRLTEQAVDHCESWANVDVLTTLCRRHGRMSSGNMPRTSLSPAKAGTQASEPPQNQ
jgi:2-methylcitrate dehydratase PrpD